MDVKGIKAGIRLSAVIGIIAACIPCCVGLAAPLLGWLGISGIAIVETGKYVEIGVVSILMLGASLLFRAHVRRRARGTQACNSNGSCGCPSGS